MSATSVGSVSHGRSFWPMAFLHSLNSTVSLLMLSQVGDLNRIESIYKSKLNILEFTGFLGQYTSSRKEPDAHIVPDSLNMPTIVVESGWSESRVQLHRDRDLWLIGGRGLVNVAIIIKWAKTSVNEVSGDIEVFDLDPQGAVRSLQREVITFKSNYSYILSPSS
jgi:hypothetical protein